MRPIAYRAALGITKSVEHRQRHEGLLPPTVLVSARAAALPAHEVEIIATARTAGATDDEIRAIVKRLTAARQTNVEELLKQVGA